MEWIAEDMQMRSEEDWYRVKLSDIADRGGRGFLKYYNNTLVNALRDIFPKVQWKCWKFLNVDSEHWNEWKNGRMFCDWFADEHEIESTKQWQRVTFTDIQTTRGWFSSKFH